jgi:hypothetical protein
MKMRNSRGRAAAGVALTAGLLVAPQTALAVDHGHMHNGSAQLRAAKGFPNAHGPVAYHADYDSHHADMDSEFHLVLRGVKKLSGKRVRVFVHGELMGRARVNDDGRARFHQHQGLGDMHDGWGIRVRTPSGKLVARGSFESHM